MAKLFDYYLRALTISHETGTKQSEVLHLVNLGLAKMHPAWDSENEREMSIYLDEATLRSEAAQSALKRGQTLDWDATLKAILTTP
jgi:hypothetical protein